MKRFIISICILLCSIQAETLRLNDSTINLYHPRIGLALGGGGAKGLVHIGILQTFEKADIPISGISGTSMGAIIAGLYAINYSPSELRAIALSLEPERFFSFNYTKRNAYVTAHLFSAPAQNPIGLFDSHPIELALQEWTMSRDLTYSNNFDLYPTPLRIIATNAVTGKKETFTNGPLAQTMTASLSIPFVFYPYYYKGCYFIDGALLENVPVSALSIDSYDCIIAINPDILETRPEQLATLETYASHLTTLAVNSITNESLNDADIVITINPHELPVDGAFSSVDTYAKTGRHAAIKAIYALTPYYVSFDQKSPLLTNCTLEDHTDLHLFLPKPDMHLSQIMRTLYQQSHYPLDITIENENTNTKIIVRKTPNSLITSFNYQGYALPKKLTKQINTTYTGKLYTKKNAEAIRSQIEAYARDKNLLLISHISYAQETLTIMIDQPRINNIIITGNTTIDAETIRSSIKLHTPSIYDPDKIAFIERYLLNTGLFYSAHLYTIPDQPQGLTLIVEVKEKQRGFAYVDGWYYSSEAQPGFRFGLEQIFPTQKTKASLIAQTGRYSGALAELDITDIADSSLGVGFSHHTINHEHAAYDGSLHLIETYAFTDHLSDLYLSHVSYDYLFIGIGYRWRSIEKRTSIKEYNTEFIQFQLDTRDQTILPHRGLLLKTDLLPYQDTTQTWLSIPLGNANTIWWRHSAGYTKLNTPELYAQPEQSLLPFGGIIDLGRSQKHIYDRLSFIHPGFFGSVIEWGIDALYWSDSELTQNNGYGIANHWATGIGLLTLGYGTNHYNNTFYINLSQAL